MAKSILIVGLGGFIGTVLRFLVSRYLQINYTTVFPWGTFLVNILGSFLIGIVFGISEKENIMSPEWRIFLTVGVCGGFTTFSSLSNEAFILLQSKEMLRFALYSGLSFFLGIFAVYFGRLIIKIA
jgi:CrcB protein